MIKKLALVLFVMFSVSGCFSPSPLIKASLEGDNKEIRGLIQKGADVNERGALPNPTKYAPKYFLKSTPLMAAALYGKKETVEDLLSLGADINLENMLCLSAVHLATYNKQTEMVRLLLGKGARVNPENPSSGWCYPMSTPLQTAASNGDLELVKLLLLSGADIDAAGYCGYTPLLLAANEGQANVVEYLLKRGADPKRKSLDKLGCQATTPLMAAEKEGHAAVVRLLQDAEMGRIMVQRFVAAPPEVPSEAAAFEAEAKKYRGLAVKPAMPEEANKYRAQAEFAFQQKRFEDAVDLYGKALKIAPTWPDGHYNRALILGELARYEEAKREMKRYLLLAPEAADAREAQDRIYQWESVAE